MCRHCGTYPEMVLEEQSFLVHDGHPKVAHRALAPLPALGSFLAMEMAHRAKRAPTVIISDKLAGKIQVYAQALRHLS